MSSADAKLLLAMSRGDESAARTLHARIGPRLSAYARAFLRDDAAADDVVQQTWLRALSRGADELARVDDALAWLIRIARNTALNSLRSQDRARATAHRLASMDSAGPPTTPQDHIELLAAIQTLSNDHRELVLLRHVASLTFDQIAETLGENRHTIASRYRAAIDRLRTQLLPQREAIHA